MFFFSQVQNSTQQLLFFGFHQNLPKSRIKLLLLFQSSSLFFSCTFSPPASSLVQASLSVNDFKGVSSHFLPYARFSKKLEQKF